MAVESFALPPWLEGLLGSLSQAHAKGRLGHGLLLAGPRGLGKLCLAQRLAAELLGLGQGDAPQFHPDYHAVQPPEGKTNLGVDQIRELCAGLGLTSHGGGAKVAVLSPAESMTLSAANALLKTLEEPAPRTYLILVSHQPGRLPATIRSRCQLYAVSRPSSEDALAWLGERGGLRANQWRELLYFADGAPLAALELKKSDFLHVNDELHSELKAISGGKVDPIRVAERWAKSDPARCLGWLATQVRAVIRNMASGNEVTDWPAATLHNIAAAERLKVSIARAEAIEEARRLMGSGVNMEMTLRALLFEFAPGATGKRE